VFFLLPACSASAKLIWLIALAPLQGSALHARNVLLIRPSLEVGALIWLDGRGASNTPAVAFDTSHLRRCFRTDNLPRGKQPSNICVLCV
ncbi:hypothetical protein ACSFBI_32290, partial [Variovorax sp. RB3P1]|uniref:hypothetical protein n=1 Tax=Variovorax sp. RB3P1 TaxID=3443732 RepID=UPI003F46A482